MDDAPITAWIADLDGRQRARRLARREFRAHRTPLVLALLALLAVASWVVTAEIVARLAGHPAGLLPVHAVVALLRRTSWGDRAVGVVGYALLASGALLLLAAVPGRWRLLPVRTEDGRLAGGVPRRDVQRALTRAARTVPGAERARVRVRGRTRPRVVVKIRGSRAVPAAGRTRVRGWTRPRVVVKDRAVPGAERTRVRGRARSLAADVGDVVRGRLAGFGLSHEVRVDVRRGGA
ncbi:DUF6286 domain-containing protein [Actinomadura rayongensis]|uniref:DUF6286 domain-containing protein n=1 Tax=Actinomadura rayongensis TaxID=1429076 RepID=A0A6I4W816_9ACTN|nr:DUF6286 domain-containing protein [Actinomadura rayongensis]MXQ62872.1 hypothetical protein [Actinomadura rayongensis]